MVHNCVDWTASPPARKIPLLVLTWGDDRVYTSIPKDFKTLKEMAIREFGFTNVEIKLYSSCINLCDGLPARITESTWEHMSPYIGCASVGICGDIQNGRLNHEAGATEDNRRARLEPLDEELGLRAPNLFPEALDDNSSQAERRLSGKQNPLAKQSIRQDPPSDHEHDDETEHEEPPLQKPEQPWEEDVSAAPPPRSRGRQWVVSEDEDASDQSEREDAPPAKPSRPLTVSPPREINKEKDENSQRRPQADLQSQEAPRRSSKPIKEERRESGSRLYNDERGSQGLRPASQSQEESQPTRTVEPSDSQKLMIRVAHRASKQESKFTTKNSTKVSKVMAGACKSFGLDATRATLYLIVSVDGDGDTEENLFPCDKNDTISRAGAEHDTETKFLLKIAGDA